jgi:putative FmdB family regulatory protein
MPLYEYQCDACAHRFEVIQKYSDAPIDVCPKCGGAVSKLLSSPAIQFKGSGFYLTDYGRAGKSDSSNVSAGKNESGGSSSESKSESKAESKPDTKSAPAPSASPTKSD